MASARLAAVAGVLLLVAIGSAVRVVGAFSDARFDAARPERLLKSDPALLYYLLERVIAAGGGVPDDFRADPRVEHPERVDLALLDSVGMEFPLAWIHRATGGGAPLVAFCTVAMAIAASLAVVGVYLVARELDGRVSSGLFAGLLFTLSPASYRTMGFVLMREDTSLPLFALHLGLLARAARVRTPAAFALAGLAALAAAATWHAMGFLLALEAAAVFAWFARSGRSPLAARHAWIVPALVALGSFLVPLLRARWFVWSLPLQLAAALGAGAVVERRSTSRWHAVAAGLATLVLLQAGSAWLARLGIGGAGDYAHVTSLAWAKLVHMGELPDDPRLLPFDVRLMWQGPFETGSLRELFAGFTVCAVLLPVAALRVAPAWLRGRGDGAHAALVLLGLLGCVAALGIRRMLALPAIVLPAVCAPLAPEAGVERRRWLAGLAIAQAIAFAAILPHRDVPWYFPLQQEEIAAVVDFIRRELPPDGAIAADNVTSPAILALTGHAIVVQPKYETESSRRRNERLLRTLYEGSAEDLRALLREWDVRWLLIDRQTLWLFRYVAGLPLALREPPPGTAAWRFLSQDPSRFDGVAGFRLLYRSALPQDMMRLYEVL